MSASTTVGYRCPVCRERLAEAPGDFACTNGHRFDRAREGYVNLLPGGRLKGRSSGDDEPMVRARRAVFDAGLYDPIIDAVAETAATLVDDVGPPAVVDCGCGEGSYLARVCDHTGAEGWGIDISKPAVRAAARRYTLQHHAVASSYSLPFDDQCFDIAVSVFSPRPHSEMFRVLRPDGAAIVVRPGPDHLAELKAIIYTAPRRHGDVADQDDAEGWPKAVSTRAVTFEVDLAEPVLRTALLEMTPFWWSATDAQRAEVADQVLRVTADMRIAVFRSQA
ncbi:MAG: Methyltransferase type 11 [Acidimicrobiales bacterium]|nr:Methyltransferase type 11 [Acidimicrobiales bacterium]